MVEAVNVMTNVKEPFPLPPAREYCSQTVSREDAGNGGREGPLPLPRAGEGWGEGRLWALIAILLLAAGCTNNVKLRDEELARIDEWLPGVYDNRPQVDSDLAKNATEIHTPIELVMLPVSAQIIGEHVYYMESRDSMNPRRIIDQRIYSFETSADKKAIVQTLYRFKEPDRWAGGKRRADIFRSMVPDDLSSASSCVIKWEFDGLRFNGISSPASCRAPAEAGISTFLELRFELEPHELRMSERSLDAAGNVLVGRRDDPLFIFRKTALETE